MGVLVRTQFQTELMKQCSGCFKTFSNQPSSPTPPPLTNPYHLKVCSKTRECVSVEILREALFFPLFARSFVGLALAFASLLPLFCCEAMLIWIRISLLLLLFLLLTDNPSSFTRRPASTTPFEIVEIYAYICMELPTRQRPFAAFSPNFPTLSPPGLTGRAQVEKLNCGFLCVIRIFVRLLRPSISLSFCSSDIIF